MEGKGIMKIGNDEAKPDKETPEDYEEYELGR